MSKLGQYANKLYLISEKVRRGCCCADTPYDPGKCCRDSCQWSDPFWNFDFCGSCSGPFVVTQSVLQYQQPGETNYIQTPTTAFDEAISDRSPFGGGDVGSPVYPCGGVDSSTAPYVLGSTLYRWTAFDFSQVINPILGVTFVNESAQQETFFAEACPNVGSGGSGQDALAFSWFFDSYNSSRDTAYLLNIQGLVYTTVNVEPETDLPYSGSYQFTHVANAFDIQITIVRDWRANGGLVSADLRCPDRLNGPIGSTSYEYFWLSDQGVGDEPWTIPITIPASSDGWNQSPDTPFGDITVNNFTAWQPTWRNVTDEDCTQTCIYGLA